MFYFKFLKRIFLACTVLLSALSLAGCGAHVYHQVRKGDTLYSISWHYNQDFRQVAKWNSLDSSYVIKEGQWLRVAPPSLQANAGNRTSVSRSRASQNAAEASKSLPKFESPIYTSKIEWQWPAQGKVISRFNSKSPGKQGIDISGRMGNSIHAAASGKVVYAGNGLRGYGNLIIIKHNDKYLSAYAHNQQLVVKEGYQVKRGQVIAYMGNTEAEQVKLHFQVRMDGKPVDPMRYLPAAGS